MEKENDVKKNVVKISCHPGPCRTGTCGVCRLLYRRLLRKDNKQPINGRCRIAAFRHDRPLCNAGFTLIELLVVVLIIGILAAVALPQYQKAVDKARYTQARSLVESLWQAEQLYKMENGSYTWDFDDLDIEMPTPTRTQSHSDANLYFYNWGKCWLHRTSYVACSISLDGSSKVWYFARPNSTARTCWAEPGTSARANALCKHVTHQTTGTDNGSYKMYNF